jgi:hypothetical protein
MCPLEANTYEVTLAQWISIQQQCLVAVYMKAYGALWDAPFPIGEKKKPSFLSNK